MERIKDGVELTQMKLTDVDFVLELENNQEIWEVSNNDSKYSRSDIEKLVESLQDVNIAKQMRFMIWWKKSRIGTVDLTDISFTDKSADVGIVVFPPNLRGRGLGAKALLGIEKIAKELGIDCLNAIVQEKNRASNQLFLKCGYAKKKGLVISDNNKADYIDMEHYEKWLKN